MFRHVSFVSLPTMMAAESIRSRPVRDGGHDFWSVCRLPNDWYDGDDQVFEIESQDGPAYYIVAKSVEYVANPLHR